MKKATKLIEWIVIGLFIAIVTSVVSILIYRSVVNSDRYREWQTKKSFSQVAEKVNEAEKIDYIKVDGDGEDRFIYDIPAELFDDLSIKSYEHIEDIEKQIEIWSQGCVTVFYTDGTTTSFFITEEGELYWGTSLKVECPSLLAWYSSKIQN